MIFLYETEVSKDPQQSPLRWVIGTGQLGRLTVPGRAHYPSGGAA